jgi:hypothetical protein
VTAALAYPPQIAAHARVVIRAAPRREPPFDDELVDPLASVGPFDQRLPFAVSPARIAWRPRPRRPSDVPDPEPWSRRLVIGLIETAAGRRPLHQLSALLSPSVSRGLGADFDRAAHNGTPHWLHRANVRTIRAAEPTDGVAEVTATVETGHRVRAMAMRLEVRHGRWRCTRLQLG